GGGGDVNQNAFSTFSVAGQDSIAADNPEDSITFIAGSNITISTNATNDAITINASVPGGGGGGTDLNSLVGGDIDVASDSIGFIDADASNASKKESIVDIVAAIAGANITATAGVLSVAAPTSAYTNSDVDTHLNISAAGTNEILSWTGSDYAWVADQTGGGGGSGAVRVSETETTSSIADGASASVAYATLGKSFSLQKVTVDKQCWVRIYSDTAARTADASRTQGTDPADGSGVIAEFIATGSGSTEFKITPAISGWLDDSETEVPVAIQNNSGSAGTVQCIIQALKLES
ncbi:MAG: hypothetical protein ACKVJK_15305, partial [Methylophagaceae bacterium]